MADGAGKNAGKNAGTSQVIDGVLRDASGQEWTTKHSRWATAKQAAGFVGREAPVGLIDAPGQPVTWMNGQQSQQWWAHAKLYFEVPGKVETEPDDRNRTWAAHIWERGADRLLVFETLS